MRVVVERRPKVGVDDRPCIGIGVIDLDLVDSQLVFEDVVLDAGEAQRARDVEALHFQVARDQLQRSDPAPAQESTKARRSANAVPGPHRPSRVA